MEEFINIIIELGTNVGGKILFALLVFIVGNLVIKSVKKLMDKADKIAKLDKTVQSFVKSLVSVTLYALLIISVISILGIPMTSIIAVLASCGLAVGLSLQGALSNFAGGLMILIFKPFRVGDYVSASGAEGTVEDISVFYTSIVTIDNKRITVPNGALMNSNVVNFSIEDNRRVDLSFKVTNACDQELAKAVLLKAAGETEGVLSDPAPFARMTGVDEDTFVFTVRAWCESANYWNVYFDLLEGCTAALGANGIGDPVDKVSVQMAKNA